VPWVDRTHFFSIAARLMRRILVDHAKQRSTDKRAGSVTLFEIREHDAEAPDIGFGIVEIDQALNQLAAVDRRLADIVEIHYFSGLSVEETAAALDVSGSRAVVDPDDVALKVYLYGRAQSVMGGTSQIQKNIIATRILGLPTG